MATITVFGGTGFLGRRIVRRLAEDGAMVRVAVRHPEQGHGMLGAPDVAFLHADVRDQASVAAALAGADAAVNAVSAYVEKGGVSFEAVHERAAAAVAGAAAAAGVSRFVLVSGIGADAQSHSPYIRARGRGEMLVRQAFPAATIVRSAAMFGEGDALFSVLADLARRFPILPLIGGGHTRLQPVYVQDVAAAIARILAEPSAAGRTYELAGPIVYTLHELADMVLRLVERRRLLLPVPFGLAELQARLFELLPNPPLTTGQVDLLKVDNLASGALPGFRDLGVEPRSPTEIVPTYIGPPH